MTLAVALIMPLVGRWARSSFNGFLHAFDMFDLAMLVKIDGASPHAERARIHLLCRHTYKVSGPALSLQPSLWTFIIHQSDVCFHTERRL